MTPSWPGGCAGRTPTWTADHATNIAEMVIYMVESKMVRHMLA